MKIKFSFIKTIQGITPFFLDKKMHPKKVNSFRGKHFFLSNFFPSPVQYNGHIYATAEHAFQAAKCERAEEAEMIRGLKTANLAKFKGRRVKLRSDWEKIKKRVMYEIVSEKFKNQTLKQVLLNTKLSKLIEGNTWHDTYWGVCECKKCNGKGQNMLGEILMRVRSDIIHKKDE